VAPWSKMTRNKKYLQYVTGEWANFLEREVFTAMKIHVVV